MEKINLPDWHTDDWVSNNPNGDDIEDLLVTIMLKINEIIEELNK